MEHISVFVDEYNIKKSFTWKDEEVNICNLLAT
jgi:hypothetical protein